MIKINQHTDEVNKSLMLDTTLNNSKLDNSMFNISSDNKKKSNNVDCLNDSMLKVIDKVKNKKTNEFIGIFTNKVSTNRNTNNEILIKDELNNKDEDKNEFNDSML